MSECIVTELNPDVSRSKSIFPYLRKNDKKANFLIIGPNKCGKSDLSKKLHQNRHMIY